MANPLGCGVPSLLRGWVWIGCVVALAAAGCGSSSSGGGGTGGSGGGATGGTGGSGGGSATRLVVTADWLNQSLTLLDYERLTDGQSTGEESIVGTIDLSDYEPGPLELELTPDGETAVVSVAPGFFDGSGLTNMAIGSPDVPPGGTLLIVDLATGEATSVETEDVPMGIAINPEGTLAYTANYGTTGNRGDTMSIVDISAGAVVEEVTVGSNPEQVVLSADGTLGAINLTSGSVRVFQTSDPSGTLSDPLSTGNDPSDLAFLADNTRLVVANSQSFNVTLVDTSDPSAPTVIDDFNTQGGVPYGTTYVPSRSWILAPTTQLSTGVPSALNIFEVEGDVLSTLSVETLPGGSFPLTAAVDAEGDFAFVAHVSDQQLSIIDLETLAIRSVSWLDDFGPTYAAVQP